MIGYFGVIAALVLLTVLSFKGWNSILVGVAGAIIVGLTNGFGFLPLLNDYYIPGVISFIQPWFLVFLTGTIYAEIMADSKSVKTISYGLIKVFGRKRVLVVISVITAVLVYGGINAYAVIFILWPICQIFTKETGTPIALWVPAIYTGMLLSGVLPGNAGMSNLIAAELLDVSPTAAPLMGIVAFIISFGFGNAYLLWQDKRLRLKPGFVDARTNETAELEENDDAPHFIIAIFPMLVLIVLYTTLARGYFTEPVSALNAIIVAMCAASFVAILVNIRRLKELKKTLVNGSTKSINPLITAAVITGFVSVVAETPAFAHFTQAIVNMPGHPYIQILIAGNVTAAVTGSAMVATQLLIGTLGPVWLSQGISADVIARMLTITTGGSCIVPHSGGLQGVLAHTKGSLKESYLHTLIVTGGALFIATLVIIVLAFIGIF